MKELANLFYDQAIGTHDGHMAAIPNNPLFRSIFMAAGVPHIHDGNARKKMSEVLRNFAEYIEKEQDRF